MKKKESYNINIIILVALIIIIIVSVVSICEINKNKLLDEFCQTQSYNSSTDSTMEYDNHVYHVNIECDNKEIFWDKHIQKKCIEKDKWKECVEYKKYYE